MNVTVEDLIRVRDDVFSRCIEHQSVMRAFDGHPWRPLINLMAEVAENASASYDEQSKTHMIDHYELLGVVGTFYILGYEVGRQQTNERSN